MMVVHAVTRRGQDLLFLLTAVEDMATQSMRQRGMSCHGRYSVLLKKTYPRKEVGVGADPRSITVGDFNGDGRPDLATANANAKTVSIRVDGLSSSSNNVIHPSMTKPSRPPSRRRN